MSRFKLSLLLIKTNYYAADGPKSCTQTVVPSPICFKSVFIFFNYFSTDSNVWLFLLLIMAIKYFHIYMVSLIKVSSS